MKLHLKSEQVGALGGITGEGAMKSLGAPRLDHLELMVREAVQNSWDARHEDSGSIRFGISAVDFKGVQREQLKALLQEGFESDPRLFKPIEASQSFDGIIIYDRGTRGLGGPLDPSVATRGEARDFVRFVYMVGETKPQEASGVATGGTYGFGRSSFMRASNLGTVLIHSVCDYGPSGRQSRFIGMTWSGPYEDDGRKFTGRHWWGREDASGWKGPLLDADADALACALGMPLPANEEMGTTILVLQPKWGVGLEGAEGTSSEKERQDAADRICTSLLRNCWPRMVDEHERISFELEWFGTSIEPPNPVTHPRLKHFVRAFKAATASPPPDSATTQQVSIDCYNPIEHLGKLGLVRSAFSSVAGSGERQEDPVFDECIALHHVALMRNTRLVVRYLSAPQATEGFQYAGVFIAASEVDEVFARSEPPSHDNWVKENLKNRRERTFVNMALQRVGEAARAFAVPGAASAASPDSGGGLGTLSEALGQLLIGIPGGSAHIPMQPLVAQGADGRPPLVTGTGITPVGSSAYGGTGAGGAGARTPSGTGTAGGFGSPASPNAGGRKGTLRVLSPRRRFEGERLLIEFPFEAAPPSGGERLALCVKTRVETDGGGQESAAPQGARVPEVVGWILEGTTQPYLGERLELRGRGEVRGRVIIAQPRDCRVRVSLDLDSPGN